MSSDNTEKENVELEFPAPTMERLRKQAELSDTPLPILLQVWVEEMLVKQETDPEPNPDFPFLGAGD